MVFLAKNKGYQNMVKMSSLAFTDKFYYVPRIDRKIVEQYKEDLIVLTGNLYGEVPSKILNVGEHQAEDALLWWNAQFQEDLYIELMRHGQEDEDHVNAVLINFAKSTTLRFWRQTISVILTKPRPMLTIFCCVSKMVKNNPHL